MNLTLGETRDSTRRNQRNTNLQACHQMLVFEKLLPAGCQAEPRG